MSNASAECYPDSQFDSRRAILDEAGKHVATALERHLSAWIGRGALLGDDDDGPSEKAAVYSLGLAEGRARTEVNRLRRRGLINASVARDAATIIKFLFKPNTVYASISHDDNGVIFYWKAAHMSVEIDVFPGGEGFWWSVTDVAHESYEGSGHTLPTERLKHSLNQFSKEVEFANPNWRNQTV